MDVRCGHRLTLEWFGRTNVPLAVLLCQQAARPCLPNFIIDDAVVAQLIPDVVLLVERRHTMVIAFIPHITNPIGIHWAPLFLGCTLATSDHPIEFAHPVAELDRA